MNTFVQSMLLGALTICCCMGTAAQSDPKGPGKVEHMWDAKVTIGDGIQLGDSKYGWRRIFRPDGDTELYARYLLKTEDGYIIQVINRVLMHDPGPDKGEQPYIRSVIDLEAPNDSPYEYLNHAIFLGTLSQPPLQEGEEDHVVIGVYRLL
jgi:hypothetical protein